MVNTLVGQNGYLARISARREYEATAAELARVRADNDRLRQEAARLRDDPSAIEEEARRTLGLIKPGETLIMLQTPPVRGAGSH
jgi:cell division protein FtsB